MVFILKFLTSLLYYLLLSPSIVIIYYDIYGSGHWSVSITVS